MDGRWRDRDSAPDRGDLDPGADVGTPTAPGPRDLYRDDPEDIFPIDRAPERPGPGRADRRDRAGSEEPDRRPDPERPDSRDGHRQVQNGRSVDGGTNGVTVERMSPGADRSDGVADRTAAGRSRLDDDTDRAVGSDSKALGGAAAARTIDRSRTDTDPTAPVSDRSDGASNGPTARGRDRLGIDTDPSVRPDQHDRDGDRAGPPRPGPDIARPAPPDAVDPPARYRYADRREDLLVHPTEIRDRRITLDAPLDNGLTPRALFTGFDPTRANRTDLREDEALAHLRDRVRTQPRLVAVMDQQHCVQRAYAIFDSGVFHGTVRHEGGMRDTDHERRVLLREDPAQIDDAKRARGMDGYRKGRHLCPEFSTSIDDPILYLVALVRGVERPDVQAALATPYTPDEQPEPVHVPITELLGSTGHEHCRGFQLVGDDSETAREQRDAWLKAGWKGQPRDHLTMPSAEPIPTFAGGAIEFRFGQSRAKDGYELISMFPVPPGWLDRESRKRGQER